MAASKGSVDLSPAAEPVRTIVARILGREQPSSMIPLGALLAPLARIPDLPLSDLFESGTHFTVVERIHAVRSLQIADGDRPVMEASMGTLAMAQLRLLTAGNEAFRCEIQMLQVERNRLATEWAGAPAARNGTSLQFCVGPDEHRAYAEASGDFNPLHMDRTLCTELGMPERVVHGTLLATLAETMCDAATPSRLTVRFASPCFVGDVLSASILDRPEGRRVLIHRAGGRLVCAADGRRS